MKSNLFKRITSGFLAMLLTLSNLPVLSFAAEDTSLCPHHESHQDCGYQEAVEGSECTHQCDESCYVTQQVCVHVHGDCGYMAAVAEIPCDHVHGDCGYIDAVAGIPCDHVHGDCGYIDVVEGTACDHVHGDCGYAEAEEEIPCDHVCGEDCAEGCVHLCGDGSCAYSEGIPGSDCTHICADGTCAYSEGTTGADCTHVCGNGSCAYSAGTEGAACGHTCEDGTCAYAPGTEEVPCAHQCSAETGCVTKQSSCVHAHDEACGYTEAVEAQPCDYVCTECAEAEEASQPASMTQQITGNFSPASDLPDNDELFQAYVEQRLYDTQRATFGTTGRDSLNEIEQELYDQLKAHVQAIALAGGDTTYTLSDTGSLKVRWTNEELGMDSLTAEALQTAFDAQFDPDALITALMQDCPFELYWYDKTASGGMEESYSFSLEGYNDGSQDIWTAATAENITFVFAVSEDYQGSRYSVTTDVDTVTRVRENAQAVADAAGELTDREALESFRAYICGAVSYDQEAADDATRPYGDPWQLIHVFDGDSTTNVVCEGYAKAFQYLCDLAGLDCESVSGTMTSQGETEAHMWNVVTLDGSRYLVDVTNCDEGTVGADTLLFLVTAPYASGTYTFDCGGTEVVYTCADLNLAAEEEAETPDEHTHTLDETTGQCQCGQYGTCGENLTWEYDPDSRTLTVSGEGDMPNYSYQGAPWYEFRTDIQRVVLDERITTIGSYTFYGFSNLAEVTIPANVTMIGTAAFWNCSSLTEMIVPENVKEIHYGAFGGCSGLSGITLPDSITYIGDCAFEYCTNLASVNIPAGVTYIREYTFYSCKALTRITIPKDIVCIEKNAFGYCTGLTAIDFRGQPPTIYDTAFTGITATARYSKDMPVWKSYLEDYGGTITWVAYGLCDEGHTEVTYPGSAPTCTEPGSTPLKYCDVCLEVLLADELIPATGHTEVIDDAVAPTCTEPGLTEGKHCSVCGEILVAQKVISAGHTEVIDTAVDATCTETGLTEGKHCSACDETLVAQEVVPATGHTEVIDAAVDATCTQPGLTEGKHCSVCGEVLVAQEEIPAAHDYESVYTDPTFDADGFTTFTCIHCGDSYTETDPGTMKPAAASIGDRKFGTLAEAFAAAKAGDTIQVLKTYTIPSGTSETWNLTNKTLEISSVSIGIVVNGSLKIMGGTFRGGFLRGEEKSQITIEAGTFQMDGGMRTNYGQITINGGTFTFSGDSRLVTQARFLGSNKFSKVIINNGVFYFKDNGAFYDYGLSTINGGTFYLERVGDGSIIAGYSDHRDALEIKGGTFYIGGAKGIKVDKPAQFYISGGTFLTTTDWANILVSSGGTVGVYAGTFSQDMTSFLSSGYCCPKNAEGNYVVGKHSYTVENAEEVCLKTEASCLNPAEYYLSCACGKVGTSTFYYGDALEHSFTDYFSKDSATCTGNTTEIAVCNYGCGETDEREIPDSALGHTYQNGICTVCGEVNKCGDNLDWTLESGVLTISGTGPMYDFTREDPAPWYEDRNEIRELSIANGITTIGSYAFYECRKLTSVVIPESVISIGEYAFANCVGLKNVEIPDSVVSVGGGAWSGSGVGSAVISGGAGSVKEEDFSGCEGLSELWFRGDFPGIAANAFRNVIATAYYPADNATWTADKLQNYGGTITWKPYCQDKHTEVIDEAVEATCTEPGLTEGKHCSACGEILTAQEIVPATGHTEVVDEAVAPTCTETGLAEGKHCSVCSEILVAQEVIPAGHNVEDGVCTVCGLYGTCGDNLTWTLDEVGTLTISGEGAMHDYTYSLHAPWYSLRDQIITVIIGEDVTHIGKSAFNYYKNLTGNLIIPDNVESIGEEAFQHCAGIDTLEFTSDTVPKFGTSTFNGLSELTGIYVPEKAYKQYVTALDVVNSTISGRIPIIIRDPSTDFLIEDNVLLRYSGTEVAVNIPDGITEIADKAFQKCTTVRSVSIPDSVVRLGKFSFYGCNNLVTMNLPANLQTIDWCAFENCSSWEGPLLIPKTVTEIGSNAFYGCKSLTGDLIIPDGIEIIHGHTFNGCKGLDGILVIPDSVTKIDGNAFYGCSGLQGELTIPESVTYIGPHAFYNCSGFTGALKLPSGITELANYAFYGCSGFTGTLSIPAGLQEIQLSTFQKCSGLTGIDFSDGVTKIGSTAFGGCTGLTGKLTIPGNILSIGNSAFSTCTGITEVEIEDGVTTIYNYAFQECRGITKPVVIPNSVTGLGSGVFFNTRTISSVTLGEGVTELGTSSNNNFFYRILGLEEVFFTSVTPPTVGSSAFNSTSNLKTIWVPAESLDAYTTALSGKLPEGAVIKAIGSGGTVEPDNTCGENITWTLDENGKLTISGTGAMYDYSLENPAPWYDLREEIEELAIENGVTTIGSYAFYGCTGLTKIVIPESVVSIGAFAFGNCTKLKNVEIPDNTQQVDGSAFSGCSGMETIEIPVNMDQITEDTFAGCESLSEIWFKGDFPNISENAFRNVTATAYYPADNATWTADKLQNYGGTITWKPYCQDKHTEVIDEAVEATCTEPGLTEGRHCSVCGEVFVAREEIPAGHQFQDMGDHLVCSRCDLIIGNAGEISWELDREGKLTISGKGQMENFATSSSAPWHMFADQVRSIVVESGVTCIGNNAFANLTEVSSVTIPEGVTGINYCAFQGCSALTELILPNTLETVGGAAFRNCTGLKAMKIPESVKTLGGYAFEDCTALETVFLPESIENILNGVFESCSSLQEIKLPDSLTGIGYGAFSGCEKLAEITIPQGVINIDSNAFMNCQSLKEIRFLGDAPSMGKTTVFCNVQATAYYPGNNATWTDAEKQNYGGTLTWVCADCIDGHAEVIDEGYDATCTEPGLTEGKHCSVCGEVLVTQEEIPAAGHGFDENVCITCGIVGITLKSQPVDAYALEGEYAVVTVEAEGENLSYKWFYRNAGGSGFISTSAFTGNTYKVAMNTARSGRQLYCMITDKYGNSVATDIVTISLQTPLAITKQPVSVRVKEGANAVVSIHAEGDGLTYQWFYKNSGDSKFYLTGTFKGSSYTVKMDDSRDGRQVYCVVTDRYGNSMQSDTATLSMMKTVNITRQPESVAVLEGEQAAVTLEAEGDGLTYAWYFRNAGGSKFYLTTSFTGSSYYVTMDDTRNGRQVYCVVTDAYGNTAASDTVTISMKTTVSITQQPVSVKVREGMNAIVSVRAEGDGLTYQWYYKDTNQSKFYLTNSFKGSSYSVQMNENRDGRQVYCVVIDQYGNTVQSDTATISMIHPAVITKQPASVTVLAGEKAEVSLEAEGEGLTYAWYFKNANGSKFYLTTSFTGSSYTVTMDESRAGRQVYCVVTDQYGNSVASDTVTLSMKTPLRIVQQPVSVKAADGANAVVSLRAEGDGLTYQWYWAAAESDRFQLTNTFKGSSYTVQMNDSRDGRRVYCVITDQYGDCVTTDTAALSMIRPVKLVKMPELAIANEGEMLTITLEALGDGLNYAWYFKNPGGSKFYLTTTFTGNTYSIKMTPERDGRMIYCVVTDQYGYSVTSDTLTLQMRK